METVLDSEIKKVAAELAEQEAARYDQLLSRRTRPRQAGALAAAAELLECTVDAETRQRFGALIERNRAELAERAAQAHKAAVAAAPGQFEGWSAAATAQLAEIAELPEQQAPPGPKAHLIRQPFLIWPSNSISLEAAEYSDLNSHVKFRVQTDGRLLVGNVTFYYLWVNPRDVYAWVDVVGFLALHGHAQVGADGGIFPAERFAHTVVRGGLGVLEWWNQPPTQPLPQPTQSVTPLDLEVTQGGFGEVGAIEARTIAEGHALVHRLAVVPARATLVLTLNVDVRCTNGENGGHCDLDFASDAFRVAAPSVLVSVLND